MAAIAGYGGSVVFATAVSIVQTWSIDDKADTKDITPMAAAASPRRTHMATLTGWDGTFEGTLDSADGKFKGNPPAIRAGATGTATFQAGGSMPYAGTIIITSVKVTNAVDDVIKFSCSFMGSGTLTYPT